MQVMKVSYKVAEKKSYCFTDHKDFKDVLPRYFDPIQEHFYLLPVLRQEFTIEEISRGMLDNAAIDPKVIFGTMLRKYPNSGCFFVAHNHPSGNIEPSEDDKELTSRLNEACGLMCYRLLDHFIFNSYACYSFVAHGLL